MVTAIKIGTFDQGSNAAYVRRLYLLDSATLDGLLDPIRFPNAINSLTIPVDGLAVSIGTELTYLDFQPKTCVFNENRNLDSNGYLYEVGFSFDFPRDRFEIVSWAQSTRYKEYVALWEDYTGTAYITGTNEIGLEVNITRSITALNKMAVQVSGKMVTPTYYLESVDLSLFFPAADFSFNFSLDFNS
ncbi:hypothetical protein [Runella sp.]|uniref:hypothetical protein n=1 Tax=Runella sp. TaxID=1960881 RepID=UPI003D13F7E4